jgi:ribonuclease E
LLKAKQNVLVQVTKDEVGQKGAVLTTYLSLAGRYVVLMPGSARHGVSRKIDDEETRRRMRESAALLDVPENMGVIVRTAGKDRSREELNRDLGVLLRLWENIKLASEQAKAPALIFKEQDVVIRALRDYYRDDIDEIVLDSDEAFDRAAEYMHLVMPDKRSVLTRYVERRPIFHHYRIEEQLEALYSAKVTLPSGGSLVIESTEALVSIDVNSGKQKLGGQEETALQTNLEAAREIARQLRLRDLGGIIVIDFIDMAARRHEQRVERAVKAALADDKARIKVGRISPNGTLELTRQRIRSALEVNVFRTCDVCHGTGHILKPEAHAVSVLRKLRDRSARGDLRSAKVRLEPAAANVLRTEKWSAVQEIEQRFNIHLDIIVEHSFQPGKDDFTFETDPNAVPLPIEEPNFGPAPRFEELSLEELEEEEELEREAEEEEEAELETLDEEEEEEMAENEERPVLSRGNGAGRRGAPRRRERAKVASSGTAAGDLLSGIDLAMGLPSFELVDPAELGLTAKGRATEGADTTRAEEERRRGRRGGRRRRRRQAGTEAVAQRPSGRPVGQRAAGAGGSPTSSGPIMAPSAPEKRSLWLRLAFWRKGS